MTSHIRSRHFLLALVAAASVLASSVVGQARPEGRHKAQVSPSIYEDREIKVTIAPGWRILPSPETSRRDAVDTPGRLSLEKNGYKLSLGYHLGHASGVTGGRFIEAFDLSWPGLDDPWTCSGYLKEYPQPASRNLIFINLVVDSGDPKVRENCAVPKNLGKWTERDGIKDYFGETRWVGGYFRPAEGGYFFGGNNDDCQFKGYTLTSEAKGPRRTSGCR